MYKVRCALPGLLSRCAAPPSSFLQPLQLQAWCLSYPSPLTASSTMMLSKAVLTFFVIAALSVNVLAAPLRVRVEGKVEGRGLPSQRPPQPQQPPPPPPQQPPLILPPLTEEERQDRQNRSILDFISMILGKDRRPSQPPH